MNDVRYIRLTPMGDREWDKFAKENPGIHKVIQREQRQYGSSGISLCGNIIAKWNGTVDSPTGEGNEGVWDMDTFAFATPLDIVKARLK